MKMKKITLCICLFASLAMTSQEKRIFEKEVFKISKEIEEIIKNQKDSLKVKVIAFESKLQKGEITKTTADTLKSETAIYHAKQIEIKVGAQERLLQQLVQDKTNGELASAKKDSIGVSKFELMIGSKGVYILWNAKAESISKVNQKIKRNKATTSQLIFAMGVNHVLQDHKLNTLNNSKYKFWQSHFYEVGYSFKTRFTKEASQMYFKYGVSFLWNNLRLGNNQYHVKIGNITGTDTFSTQLSESRLRHVQMNFPVHLEWDFSKNKKDKQGHVLDVVNNAVRLGIGGFVGFKLGTRQYLEYKDETDLSVSEVQYNNFNMNIINYGLSGYVGYKSISLYAKYDLNPLFKDTTIRNISMGIRLDFN